MKGVPIVFDLDLPSAQMPRRPACWYTSCYTCHAESAAPLPRERLVQLSAFHYTLGLHQGKRTMERETALVPEAEAVVLRRIGQMEGRAAATGLTEADYAALRALVVGQVVSTGDEFGDYEIIEIVPPDEPAFVAEATVVEIA